MLRNLLLFLSDRPGLRRWMETSRIPERLTRRFVAGEQLEQALAVCRRLNQDQILVTLDHLGEKVTSREEAAASLEAYEQILASIAAGGLDASVSIKLTQFGLDLGESLCRESVVRLVDSAAARSGFVELDMESREYVDRTLAIASEMHARSGRVRVAVQAYLYRTAEDVASLLSKGVPIRLCKGAYREPPTAAFRRKSDVDDNYRRLTEALLESRLYPALATHDPNMVDHAIRFAGRRGIGKTEFEFQMLYGIRRDLQAKLVREGFRLRLYVPYGVAWYPYFMRRLAERPANLVFLARNLLRR